MKYDDLCERLEFLSFTAGMNQRYHQKLATKYGAWDRRVRMITGFFAVASLIATMIINQEFAELVWWSNVILATIAALSAIALNVTPVEESKYHHLDMLRRWSDLRQDVDTLKVRVEQTQPNGKAADGVLVRVQELTGKKNFLNALESAPDKNVLEECYGDENESRTGFRSQAEKDAALAKEAATIQKREAAGV